ncbi:MAG: Cell division protein FtsZ 2 [Promethearchaeota archaeon]|nr:MAG: Cell division protein FtsZ 2 [Candidatus Lokiarchaeota archaeon]
MESLLNSARKRAVNRPTRQKIGFANIKIVGTGGAGNNTIDRLMKIEIKGAKCIAVNTDHQHLEMVRSDLKILIGKTLTRGLGAGGNPEIGKAAAEEDREDLIKVLRESDLVFVTCGEGGGTGTGSAPIIAEVAKNEGAIVVGVVTLPFDSEIGRIENAQKGLKRLKQFVDTLVVIDNNRLLDIVPDLPIIEAFSVADEVLATMVKGITETISLPSLINLDYADVKTILGTGGVTMVGVGESSGNEDRVQEAIDNALNSPLLDVDIEGAKGALIHISGGNDMTLAEANSVAARISKKMDVKNSMIIWGARVSDEFEGFLRVMLLITGIKSPQIFGKGNEFEEPQFKREFKKDKVDLSDEIFNLSEI